MKKRAIDEFRNKLTIPDSKILKCPDFEDKSKIGKVFRKHNSTDEYSVRIYEIYPYFYKSYEKKIQVHKNGCKYILFRIDLYFNKFLLAVEIDEKVYSDRDSVFEEKRQEALEKRLGYKFLRINISNTKNGFDLDYEVGNVQAFIDEFKDKQLEKEKLEKK